MDISIFTDKSKVPNQKDLKGTLGDTLNYWAQIRDYIIDKQPNAIEEWNYPGKKFGWSFRIKDKKRAIIYLLPRANFFKVALVFGQKAIDEIMQSSISEVIKQELLIAHIYAEGRGIRIAVENKGILTDIFTLIDIKLKN
ncbi:MAG: hypothetical protein HW421_434 [Ignavibacteria bacterium]|nr:hypothetical protein [Ignavibacteria bacterium]